MEEIKKEKLIKTIKPKFSLLYELGMPTGRKLKTSLFTILLFLFFIIILHVKSDFFNQYSYNISDNMTATQGLIIVMYFLLIFCIIKFFIHYVLQKKQYENVSYKFYETHMVYEDTFLNQHKKNIQYENVKEVEIRRTIWDRITGFGVVVIYTNAENKRNNGIVVYALKDPDKFYEFIDSVINNFKEKNINRKEPIKENREEVVENVDNSNQKSN